MNQLSDVMLQDASRARQTELLAEAKARRERTENMTILRRRPNGLLPVVARTVAAAVVQVVTALSTKTLRRARPTETKLRRVVH